MNILAAALAGIFMIVGGAPAWGIVVAVAVVWMAARLADVIIERLDGLLKTQDYA